jgi:hypothetical protein
MRNRIAYKVIHAGAFKAKDKTFDLVAEFASTLEPHQLVSITTTTDDKVVVWYRER